jgi:FixJ family two-component response regulator
MGEQGRPAIAVVDDDASLRRSLCNLLRSRGFTAEAFASAEEFLSSTTRRELSGCLVLDLRMSGMSGLDLLHQLRAAGADIPVVVLTAQGDEGTRQRCLEAGAVAFLVKPFRADMLLAEILAALN